MANEEIIVSIKDMIVSSTDTKGNIIYVNDNFCDIARYDREELIGQPHNIIRHPDMPKAIFKLLWQKLQAGEAIYAFVKNMVKDGDYYWVKAYVKPIVKNGKVTSYISYRKPVNNFVKGYISQLYAKLIEYEKTHSVDDSLNFLLDYLAQRNITYDQFIDRVSQQKSVENVAAMNIDYQKYQNAHIIFKANILERVELCQFDKEVTSADICEFGKWIKSCENESFAKTSSWKNVIKYHNQVHEDLDKYLQSAKNGASKSELEKIIKDVDEDTRLIFEDLVKTIDSSKE